MAEPVELLTANGRHSRQSRKLRIDTNIPRLTCDCAKIILRGRIDSSSSSPPLSPSHFMAGLCLDTRDAEIGGFLRLALCPLPPHPFDVAQCACGRRRTPQSFSGISFVNHLVTKWPYIVLMFCCLNNCGNKSALSLVTGACRAVYVRRTGTTPVF
jgi:hypothetical protein